MDVRRATGRFRPVPPIGSLDVHRAAASRFPGDRRPRVARTAPASRTTMGRRACALRPARTRRHGAGSTKRRGVGRAPTSVHVEGLHTNHLREVWVGSGRWKQAVRFVPPHAPHQSPPRRSEGIRRPPDVWGYPRSDTARIVHDRNAALAAATPRRPPPTVGLVVYCPADHLMRGCLGGDAWRGRSRQRPTEPEPWLHPETTAMRRGTLFTLTRRMNPDLWMDPSRRSHLPW